MRSDLPAAEGGHAVRESFLPFARPSIGNAEIDAVIETLRSGWLTVGPRTREFERVVADYVGVPGAAALHSCTAGLHLAMVVLGLEAGDEVVLPALNFAAAANMIIHLGARPVLIDIDPETLNADAARMAAAVTERTKLLLPLHFAGRPTDIDAVIDLAEARGLRVLADGAHAISATLDGRKIGSMADATSFSFYVTKGITTGEGGIVTSPDPEITDRIRRLSLHGMSSDAWKRYSDRGPWYYEVLEAGYKYNMNDVQAALGLCQMERVDEFRTARERIAEAYREGLADDDAVRTPSRFDRGRHAWHLYTIQVEPGLLTIGRDQFIRALLDEGIGVSVHFIPLHYHPYFRDRLGLGPGSFPATEAYFERAVSLPIYPSMTEGDVSDVIEAVRKLTRYYRR
jgi:dTDP-4-amino-4,6-dideoxygalactose transaminase